MTHKNITTSLLAIVFSCIANSSLAESQPILNYSSIEPVVMPVVVVSEYTSTPEHSDLSPVIYKSTNEGRGWVRNEIKNSHGRIRSISCNSKNYCVGVGEAYSHSTTTLMTYNSYDGGNNWTPHNLGLFGGPSGLDSVSCDTNQHCIAVGAASPVHKSGMQAIAYTSFDGGNTWTPNYPDPIDTLPSGSALRAVSCSGKGNMNCVAIGNIYQHKSNSNIFISYASTDGGLHWTHKIIETDKGIESLLGSVACKNDGQYCVTVGHLSLNYVNQPANHNIQPVMYETNNAGKDWSRVNLPFNASENASLNKVSCTNSNCIAVGSENGRPIIIKYDEKHNWKKYYPTFNSLVSAKPIAGLDVDLRILFSVKGRWLKSIICNDSGQNCTSVGYSKYTVTLNNKNKVSVTLPTIYFSSDHGNTWDHSWPGLSDESGHIHAVETVAIDITAL